MCFYVFFENQYMSSGLSKTICFKNFSILISFKPKWPKENVMVKKNTFSYLKINKIIIYLHIFINFQIHPVLCFLTKIIDSQSKITEVSSVHDQWCVN